ncbi:MAG: AsmA family protein, partial [Humidesulfovibrio sp.]|nr:AsmA family protein [Humidesulfovibrio sp.]
MRYLVIIGGIVVTLFVVAAVLLAVMVDPNKYKGDITRLVKERTGRELVFEGDVKLSFFPRLGVETGGVSLSN